MKRSKSFALAGSLAAALSVVACVAYCNGCGGDTTSGTGGAMTGGGPTTGGTVTGAASGATDTAAGAAAAGATGYTVVDVTNGGTIKGTVKFDGAIPALPDIPVSKNPEYCGAAIPNHRLVVDKATMALADTIVYLSDIHAGAKLDEPPADAKVDQLKCEYHPHVQVVPVGTKMSMVNSDDVLHNIHAYSIEGKDIFNFGMPSKGMVISNAKTTFTAPGLYQLKCDAGHVWMNAYIFVKAHPYVAVTGADGTFTFTNVPPGTYTLKAWHAGWVANVGPDAKTVDYSPPVERETKVEVKTGAEATTEIKIGGAA
jgi:plastocyanin